MTDKPTQVPAVLGVTCTFWSLAVIIVAVRVFVRTRLVKALGPDDWWMLAAIVLSTFDQSCKIAWCFHGLGMHIEDVGAHDLDSFLMLSYIVPVQYPFALGFVKMSILSFYLRVFPQKIFRHICFGVMGIVVASTVTVALGQAFACTPISDGWKAVPTGSCVDREALQVAGSIINLITDVIVLVLPMKYFYSMALDKTKRYGIMALFSLGLITCVASAYRLSTIPSFYASADKTWNSSSLCIWSCLEVNLSIITASIPSIKSLVSGYMRKSTASKPNSYGTYGSTGRSKRTLGHEEDGWQLVNRENTANASKSDIDGKNSDIHIQSDIHVQSDERV